MNKLLGLLLGATFLSGCASINETSNLEKNCNYLASARDLDNCAAAER